MRNSYLPHSNLMLTIYKGTGRLKIKDLMSDLLDNEIFPFSYLHLDVVSFHVLFLTFAKIFKQSI